MPDNIAPPPSPEVSTGARPPSPPPPAGAAAPVTPAGSAPSPAPAPKLPASPAPTAAKPSPAPQPAPLHAVQQPPPTTAPPPSRPSNFNMMMEGNRIMGQHNVPLLKRPEYAQRFNTLQNSFQQGDYLGSYPQLMGLMADLKAHDPKLPSALSPLVGKATGNNWAWDLANTWHGMVGTPQGFSSLLGGLAPGLLKGVGSIGGLGGVLGLHGLVSGNSKVLQDLKTLLAPVPKTAEAFGQRYTSLLPR